MLEVFTQMSHFMHSKYHRLFFVQLSSLHNQARKPVSQNAKHRSCTVKYLMDKWGISKYKASKYVDFAKGKADACLSFFKSHGFSDAQLSKLLKKCPTLLMPDIQKILLPKIQFLHSRGFLERDITAMVVAEPTILVRSLEGHLVPTFDLLKHHLGSVETTVQTIKRYPRILSYDKTHVLHHNIQLLKEAGVPSRCIASGLRSHPAVFSCSYDEMQEVVKDIENMGFDHRSWKFMAGVCTMGSSTKLAWKNRLEVYQRWGCSQEEVLMAFKREPRCIKVSEEMIDTVLDFFVNEMGWRPQMVLLRPQLFTYSLRKRIVPRCSVYKHLLSKDKLKVKGNFLAVIKYSEDKFLEKFINCYPKEAPELLRLYEEKMKDSMNEYNSENEVLQKSINCLPEEPGNHSFTVKYLTHKCRFSKDEAVSASKYVNFDKPDRPDACLSFLKNHGFTDTQLLKLLRKCPRIIVCDPEKTLLPKIQFLHSKGFLETEIPAMLVADPNLFQRSLEGCLVPIFDLLEDHLCSVENTIKTVKSYLRILSVCDTRVLDHNIKLMKEAGVPSRCIACALRTQPLLFSYPCDKLQEVVKDIKEMGIKPRSWQFISAVCSMGSLGKLAWKNKLEVYKRWGCSEQEVLIAFKRDSRCMKVSEIKIDGVMDFFANEMGWRPQMLLRTPKLFTYSLKRRIVPRCSVYKLLLSKGLVKLNCSSVSVIVKYSEDKFLEKFINCYREEAPELFRLYEEKLKSSINRYISEDEFLEKFINCDPEEAPELLLQYEEKIKNSMNRYKT